MNRPGRIDASSQENIKYRSTPLSKQTSTAHPVFVEESIVNHISTALVLSRENLILDTSLNNCVGNTVNGTKSIKSRQLVKTPRNVFEKKQKMCKLLKKFANAVHKKVENSVELFECNTCGRKFVKKFNLLRHICTHKISLHSRRLFSCEDCGKHSSEKAKLKEHFFGGTHESKAFYL